MKTNLLLLVLLASFSSVHAQFHLDTIHFNYPGQYISDISIGDASNLWGSTAKEDGSFVHEIARSIDSGNHWNSLLLPDSGLVSNVCGVNGNIAWVSLSQWDTMRSYGGRILKTIDGGASWSIQNSGGYHNGFLDFVHFFNQNTGVSIGDPNGGAFEIYTTANGGNTWTQTPSDSIPVPYADEAGQTGRFYVADSLIWFISYRTTAQTNRIFYSKDLGHKWDTLSPRLFYFHYLHNVKIGYEGYGADTCVVSYDGGQTYEIIKAFNAVGTEVIDRVGTFQDGSGGLMCSASGTFSSTALYGSDDSLRHWYAMGDFTSLSQGRFAYWYMKFLNRQLGWMSYYSSTPATRTFDIILRYEKLDPATGIAGSTAMDINIRPNPAKNWLEVSGENAFQSYIIYNLSGMKVVEYKFTPAINIESLTSGIYFIEFKKDNKSVTKKFVKL